MKSSLRRAALGIASTIAPLLPLGFYKKILPRSPIGFFYHIVSDHPLPHIQHLYPFKSISEFEQDLLWLKQNTHLLGYQDLIDYQSEARSLPGNAAYISFDDGFRECYEVVRPLLLKHNIPCMFFLTTNWIDNQQLFFRSKISLALEALSHINPAERKQILTGFAATFNSPADKSGFIRWLKSHKESTTPVVDEICARLGVDSLTFLREQKPYLTTAQIQEMHAEGFVFGAHSRNHTKFMNLREEDQAKEMIESCRIVAALTGTDQVPFAFPFSGEGVPRRMLQKLRKSNPEIGLVFDTKKLKTESHVLHRIWADKPIQTKPPAENLKHWLHDAYVRLVTRNQSHLF